MDRDLEWFNNQSKRRNYFNKGNRNRNKKENFKRIIIIIFVRKRMKIIKLNE